MNDKNKRTPRKPFINVFSTTGQTLPRGNAVEFGDVGEICGFELISPSTVRATAGGVYQFYYYLLPLLGPSQTPVSSAFAIEVNDQIQHQSRFGTGFEELLVQTIGPFVFWGIVTIPCNGKIRLVNIDTNPAILSNELIPVSTATAVLTLKKISD